MPEIAIQHSTLERLKRHAQPLVDTADTVIARALDALEELKGQIPDSRHVKGLERAIDPLALPTLTHTKVLDASIDGSRIARPNWNSLLDDILCRAMKRVGCLDELRRLCAVNMVEGCKVDDGYRHLPEINVSVQGQDANGACRAIVMGAQAIDMAVDVGFIWRLKAGAAHPGERGRVTIRPSKSQHD